ncbi:hypothetical protein [Kitasatospora sp. GP82]|uniref:hypothetical protein n=1 Tax=Kitasatospora sp. GP82 TaxID=3035089 RepID=UPI002472F3F4|nr:hypothetical protein [Kitasatospora sp. GP82]MDH6125948.1 hypothetical protein [Kitasatospora sp. GP82]
MSTSFYTERRKDKAAEREADRQDRLADRAEARKDADAERRRKAADRKEADARKAEARKARAAKVGKLTGWVRTNPARAFVRLVQVCSIVPAVVSQVGALTDADVAVLMAALLATMLEGAAWALVAMGSQAEGQRSTRTYRIGAWVAGGIAGWINYSHGAERYAAHSWVAWVLALSSVVAVWLTDLQTHGGRGPTKAEKQAKKEKAAHAKARAAHHPEVLGVAQELLSANPYGALHPDDAWRIAWGFVEGVEVTGVTSELIARQLQARARVDEVAVPRPVVELEPGMPPDPFLDDEESVYRMAFPEALEAASRFRSGDPETLAGIGLHGPGKAPQKAAPKPPQTPVKAVGERPLDPEHLAKVRALADLLPAGQTLSAPKIRELIGCRNEYAVRLRRAIEAERGDDGGLAGVR